MSTVDPGAVEWKRSSGSLGAPVVEERIDLLDRTPWHKFEPGTAFTCRVLISPEDDGGYSIHALDLPGVVSQGETEEEAVENFRDAFAGVVAAYRDAEEAIPWHDAEVERTRGSKERRVLVHV